MALRSKRIFSILRNTLLGITALVLLVFAALCYVLYQHEQEIADQLIAAFNEGQPGQLTYSEVELSPFRAFPYISIDIKRVRFDADKDSEDDAPLYAFKDVYVGFDVWDLLHGEYIIRKMVLSDGHLFLEKYKDGSYNIIRAKTREEGEDEETGSYMDLRNVTLKNVRLHEVNHGGEGNELIMDITEGTAYLSYIGDRMQLGLKSDLFMHRYHSGNTTWFREMPFGLNCDMVIENGFMTILPSTFIVEAGTLDLEGSLDLENDLMLDLRVSGRKKNFDVFISFAPPEVLEKLKEFKNEGDIFFNGHIVGPINIRSPLIDLELGCANTVFHHNKHQKALRDVAFHGRFRTGDDGSLEKGFLMLENLYGEPEKGLMRGTIRVDNLLDPRFTVDFHARFQLEHLKTFYELEAIEDGSGLVTIDITLDEYIGPDSVLHFATQMTDGVTSNIAFEDVSLKLASLARPIEKLNGKILLDGDDLKVIGLKARIGQSDLAVDLGLTNISALIHHADAPVDLVLHGESRAIHLADLLSLTKPAPSGPWAADTLTGIRFDLDLHTTVAALENSRYVPTATLNFRHLEFTSAKYPFPISDVSGRFQVDDQRLIAENFGITIGRNSLHLDADVLGLGALLDSTRQERVEHRVSIRSPYFNAKELLVYDGKAFVHDSIEEEVVQDLVFRGSGSLQSNTFTSKGFISETHIDHLSLRLNALPALRDVDGHIVTDTSGCITLKDLRLAMGRSDLHADLYLRHFLDGDLRNKHIEGSVQCTNLDLDEIAGWSPSQKDSIIHQEAFNLFKLAFPDMVLVADIGRMQHHRAVLEDVHARVRSARDHVVYMDTLSFRAAGGRVAMRGVLNGTDPDNITLTADLDLQEIDLDQVMYKMDNFGQDVMVHENLHGQVNGTINVRTHLYPDLVPDLAQTRATAQLTVRDGRLSNFGPLHAMADFMGQRDLDNVRFGELANTFTFENGVLHIPEMTITSTIGYMHLSGSQSMDLKMDYTLRVPLSLVKQAAWNSMKTRLRRNSRDREELAEIDRAEEEIITGQKGLLKGYLTVNLTGDPDDYKVRLGKARKEPEKGARIAGSAR